MKEKDLPTEDLKLLVESAYQKMEKSEEIDNAISSEMSNTLNWILALTTLFVGVCLQNYNSISGFSLKYEFLYTEKILFAISVIMLVLFKVANANYAKYKKSYLANLYNHKLELLFEITYKLKPKLLDEPFFIPSFINRFRNGEFIPDYDKERKKSFKLIDMNINIYGKSLKIIYRLTMVTFVINLILTIIIVMKINPI